MRTAEHASNHNSGLQFWAPGVTLCERTVRKDCLPVQDGEGATGSRQDPDCSLTRCKQTAERSSNQDCELWELTVQKECLLVRKECLLIQDSEGATGRSQAATRPAASAQQSMQQIMVLVCGNQPVRKDCAKALWERTVRKECLLVQDSEGATGSGQEPGSNLAHWKSTADSAPDHQTARLSKESIVPQRSEAVHDQPTADGSNKAENWQQMFVYVLISTRVAFRNIKARALLLLLFKACTPCPSHKTLFAKPFPLKPIHYMLDTCFSVFQQSCL